MNNQRSRRVRSPATRPASAAGCARPAPRVALAALAAVAAAAALAGHAGPARAEDAPPDLPLEQLLQADVQTASRKSQRLRDVAAAVFVITREDIERSGATSLPEALRLVPGMQVAQLSRNRWAVTARGFNSRIANKLLVLMDGRSLYSFLFSGVIWEREDTLLADIDRIEVIRGPHAALWGANAVNGVINIITRHARETGGTLALAAAGEGGRGVLGVRHGWALGQDQPVDSPGRAHVRLWAKTSEQDASDGAADDWRSRQAGARADWTIDATRRLTVSGGAYSSDDGDRWSMPDLLAPSGATLTPVRTHQQGTHLLARHEWLDAGGAESAVQAWAERTRIDVRGHVREERTTLDLDWQRRQQLAEAHDLVWGLTWRRSSDRGEASSFVFIQPPERTLNLASVFLQDEMTLAPALKAVLGARLERNTYTGTDLQPNLRLAWTPDDRQTWWAALSRAVHMPSRAEHDAQVDAGVVPAAGAQPAVQLRLGPEAGRAYPVERVHALEFGWRRRFGAALSTDLTLFEHRYDHLRTMVAGTPAFAFAPVPHVVQPLIAQYSGKARLRGLEFAADWRVARGLRLQPAWTWMTMRTEAATADPVDVLALDGHRATLPRHQLSLRASWDPASAWRVDGWLRHVDELPGNTQRGGIVPRVDAYTTLDLRLAWRFTPGAELALVGQNLLERRHLEFHPDSMPSEPVAVQRGAHVRLKWQF